MSIINVIKKEIEVEESLRKRLEIICDFCTFEDLHDTYETTIIKKRMILIWKFNKR